MDDIYNFGTPCSSDDSDGENSIEPVLSDEDLEDQQKLKSLYESGCKCAEKNCLLQFDYAE